MNFLRTGSLPSYFVFFSVEFNVFMVDHKGGIRIGRSSIPENVWILPRRVSEHIDISAACRNRNKLAPVAKTKLNAATVSKKVIKVCIESGEWCPSARSSKTLSTQTDQKSDTDFPLEISAEPKFVNCQPKPDSNEPKLYLWDDTCKKELWSNVNKEIDAIDADAAYLSQ